MTPRSLDAEIADASGLISLLLVFVFAYLSALLPRLEELRHRPKPAAHDDQAALRAQLSTFRGLAFGLLFVIALVLALLGPLSWRALNAQLWRPFQTLRLGLLMIDVLLLGTGIAVLSEVILLARRQKEIR